ncbi:MAG: LysE family transporter [Marinifilaceae bacterium]|nr:LysE family transporter [Marinifilaceae bacterium]
MNDLQYIIEGAILGFLCSIPLGPMGVLIIQKTLSKGPWPGFFSGLGAACADLFYASVVAFGLNFFIDDLMREHQLLVQILGGLLLVVLGVSIFFKRPKAPQGLSDQEKRISKRGLLGDFASLFFLTVSNPAMIMIFVGAFGASNILTDPETGESVSMVVKLWVLLGVLCGAALWWYLLSSLVNIFRKKFTMRTLRNINKVAGIILLIVGVLAVLSAFEAVREFLSKTPILNSI